MPHLHGKKKGGDHTTLIDLASKLVDGIQDMPEVGRISSGIIIQMQNKQASKWLVRIQDEEGCILVVVIQSATKQELRIYTTDHQKVKLAIARWVRNNKYDLRFR